MTYAELGLLKLVYAASGHECASSYEKQHLGQVFHDLCKRLNIEVLTAETFLEAMEE